MNARRPKNCGGRGSRCPKYRGSPPKIISSGAHGVSFFLDSPFNRTNIQPPRRVISENCKIFLDFPVPFASTFGPLRLAKCHETMNNNRLLARNRIERCEAWGMPCVQTFL